jgi:hypothetical protein
MSVRARGEHGRWGIYLASQGGQMSARFASSTLILSLLVLTGCHGPAKRTNCVTFDTQPAGNLAPGSGFTENHIKVTAGPSGIATVRPASGAFGGTGTPFGAGNILRVNNVTVDFDFSALSPTLVTVRFADQGGQDRLSVNGALPVTDRFATMPPQTWPGGVQSTSNVTGTVPGGKQGTLTFVGPVKTISIFGQELWLDNICTGKRRVDNQARKSE